MARFTRRERIADALLREAIDRAERGLIDADLGGGLIKQRVARPNEGRRGGYRMLVGYKEGSRAVFLFGFAKNELGNVGDEKLVALRELGAFWLGATETTIVKSLANRAITEVGDEEKGPGYGG